MLFSWFLCVTWLLQCNFPLASIKYSYLPKKDLFLIIFFSYSNTSMQEETGWRRRLSRKVLNWLLCVTPSPSTLRAPMFLSRHLLPHNTPKVIIDTHTHTNIQCTVCRLFFRIGCPWCGSRWPKRFLTLSALSCPRSAWWDGHQNHWQWENSTWQG